MEIKMFKRFLSLVLALFAVSGTIIFSPAASAGTSGDWEYGVSGGTAYITGYKGPGGNVLIPAQIDGYSVTAIGDGVFKGNSTLISVTIPEGVTSIGDYAFSNCESLLIAVIPESIERLGDFSFGCPYLRFCGYGGESLVKTSGTEQGEYIINCGSYNNSLLDAPRVNKVSSCGVTDGYAYFIKKDGTALVAGYLGNDAETTVPSELGGKPVEEIRDLAFQKLDFLKKVVVPDGVKKIGASAFSASKSLEEVVLPESVTDITYRMFTHCSSLSKVTLPDNVKSIGESAFFHCSSLTSVNIPAGVKKIGESAFEGCTSLERVDITDIASWCSITFRYNPLMYSAALYLNGEPVTDLLIPDGVKSISESAFRNCSGLTSVVLPDGLTEIGDFAFCWCPSLSSVTIPASMTKIGYYSFDGCESLKDIYFGGSKKQWDGFDVLIPDGTKVHFGSFSDVDPAAFYASPVSWAVKNGITSGTSESTFSPDEGCTRGQVVTFLWRAAGQPEPTGTDNPFRDVKSGDYFYKAVLWAVENGVTAGTSKTEFSPNDVCTRGQIVTFQWRANDQPAPKSSSNPFIDVKADDYFYKAVLWAVEKGITLGTDAKHFSPSDTCTRGQVVTFLYRDMG